MFDYLNTKPIPLRKQEKPEPYRRECTGCRVWLASCRCGRSKLNLCFGCGAKMWDREGVMIPYMVEPKEFCAKCAGKMKASDAR